MKTIDCSNWENFAEELEKLICLRKETEKRQCLGVSEFHYRGQGNDSWQLRTTLERTRRAPWSVSDYYRLIAASKPQIETFTELRWQIAAWPDFDGQLSKLDGLRLATLPVYEYLIFLRHHGFPSPLLDWTLSPYVAVFFAFANPTPGRVAIYVYWEYAGHGKTTSSGKPLLESFGPIVRSHKRHFLQQSVYTVAGELRNGTWFYAPHEDVFADSQEPQDQLWKLTIPTAERSKVLSILDAYNLNMFSLFQTEESLLSTIAVRAIDLPGGHYSDSA